jgi:hypothetical protein
MQLRRIVAGVLIALGIAATVGAGVAAADSPPMTHDQCQCMTHD